jgi:hypothetical protein
MGAKRSSISSLREMCHEREEILCHRLIRLMRDQKGAMIFGDLIKRLIMCQQFRARFRSKFCRITNIKRERAFCAQ